MTGSGLVRERRERRERGKMRQRFWELGGSRMGAAMGLKEEGGEEGDVKKEDQDENYDYKKENKFSDHLKDMKKEDRVSM